MGRPATCRACLAQTTTGCASVTHMDASSRTERITANLTPDMVARLDRFAADHHWTRSTAVAVLIEQSLPADKPTMTGAADRPVVTP